jgi:hypothetical protein
VLAFGDAHDCSILGAGEAFGREQDAGVDERLVVGSHGLEDLGPRHLIFRFRVVLDDDHEPHGVLLWLMQTQRSVRSGIDTDLAEFSNPPVTA